MLEHFLSLFYCGNIPTYKANMKSVIECLHRRQQILAGVNDVMQVSVVVADTDVSQRRPGKQPAV